jgi:hypothetical protein
MGAMQVRTGWHPIHFTRQWQRFKSVGLEFNKRAMKPVTVFAKRTKETDSCPTTEYLVLRYSWDLGSVEGLSQISSLRDLEKPSVLYQGRIRLLLTTDPLV